MRRVMLSFTGRLSRRAATAVIAACGQGKSLPPNPEPRKRVTTRTFSTGNAKHLRHHHAVIHDALRSFIHRHAIAVPHRDRCMHLNGIVRFDRRDVGLIDLYRRSRQTRRSRSPRFDAVLAFALVIVEADADAAPLSARTRPARPLLPRLPAPASRQSPPRRTVPSGGPLRLQTPIAPRCWSRCRRPERSETAARCCRDAAPEARPASARRTRI